MFQYPDRWAPSVLKQGSLDKQMQLTLLFELEFRPVWTFQVLLGKYLNNPLSPWPWHVGAFWPVFACALESCTGNALWSHCIESVFAIVPARGSQWAHLRAVRQQEGWSEEHGLCSSPSETTIGAAARRLGKVWRLKRTQCSAKHRVFCASSFVSC